MSSKMNLTCSLRRRISKKWLTLILACCVIDSILVLLYYQLGTGTSHREVTTQHHELQERNKISDKLHLSSQPPSSSSSSSSSPSSSPSSLRKDDKNIQQNVKYMENILSKMEKSLEKDKQQLDSSLPKPWEMLRQVEGPVQKVSLKNKKSRKKSVKMFIVAREHTGFPVLGQFLTDQNDFFVHGEPPGPLEVDTVTNLLNCVLPPAIVQNFSSLLATDFGQSSYFRESCLLASGTVCTDPLSYERSCSARPHQVIRSTHAELNFSRQIMEENPDIKVIFLVRDPRGILRDTKLKPLRLCSDLSREWDEALRLVSDFPHQFHLARYETLAVTPHTEFTNVLKSLNLPILTSLANDDVAPEEDDLDWNPRKNSIKRVNSWKSGLSNKELKSIENVCVETLSKMEYQILSPQ